MFKEPSLEKEQTPEAIRMRIHEDPKYLPTIDEIKKAFPADIDSVTWDKFFGIWQTSSPAHEKMIHKPEYDSYENQIHDIWNREYIEALGQYLLSRREELGLKEGERMRVLEVGAGDGKLSEFLREQSGLKSLSDSELELLAIDDGSSHIKQPFEVANVPIDEALEAFKPHIVITAWMPYLEDWTQQYRDQEEVQEYILIGDPEPTGDEDKTWGGNPYDLEKEIDGFISADLQDLSDLQFCRTDSSKRGHSKTVSFKRIKT